MPEDGHPVFLYGHRLCRRQGRRDGPAEQQKALRAGREHRQPHADPRLRADGRASALQRRDAPAGGADRADLPRADRAELPHGKGAARQGQRGGALPVHVHLFEYRLPRLPDRRVAAGVSGDVLCDAVRAVFPAVLLELRRKPHPRRGAVPVPVAGAAAAVRGGRRWPRWRSICPAGSLRRCCTRPSSMSATSRARSSC